MATHQQDSFAELRAAVRGLCNTFPPEYWRELDERRGYPEAFVKALTEAGWLAALIPEEYGGAGLGIDRGVGDPGGDQSLRGQTPARATPRCTSWARLLRHGSAEQKRSTCPRSPRASCGCSRSASPSLRPGTDTTKLKTTAVRRGDRYVVNGQKVWISRVQHSDLMLLLARTTPLPEVTRKSEGLSVFLVDLRDAIGRGMTRAADSQHGEPRNQRSVLRQSRSACGKPDRRRGQRIPLHPRRHERRADSDRRGMRRRRVLVHREGRVHTRAIASCSTGRSGKTRGYSFPSRVPTSTYERPI